MQELGGEVADSNAELAAAADVIVLCHKPDQLGAVAQQVAGNEGGKAVVSILAGVTLDALRRAYPGARVCG